MSLQNKISDDIKQAMRDKNAPLLNVLRMLLSSIKNKAIALRSADAVELSDEQVLEVITSEVKKRQDAATDYSAGGRPELAEQELAEVKLLAVYLPAQLSDEEVLAEVTEIVAGLEKKDFAMAMKESMAKLKGRADGKRVGEAVKKVIG